VSAVGVGQRIEAQNCFDLVGGKATLSVDMSNSALTAVTWTVFRANTEDTFGTLASPTRTQVATGTFTVSASLARYKATFDVPEAATTGLEVVLTIGAQTSGTWVIGNVQLEAGAVMTPFERRPVGMELQLCQRYFITYGGSSAFETIGYGFCADTTSAQIGVYLPVVTRKFPALGVIGNLQTSDGSIGTAVTSSFLPANQSGQNLTVVFGVAGGLTAHRPIRVEASNTLSARVQFNAEMIE